MIPFYKPKFNPEVMPLLEEVLRSGWITTGPKTKAFEKEITAFCGNKITNALGSATAGMELVLRWYGVGPGDEVIIPAYTYCATANVVMHLGAKPVMVDIRDDFNIDPTEIEKHITDKTKAIVPVDFAGWPCDYETINQIALKHKSSFNPHSEEQKKLGRILVMADAAHSFGAERGNKKSGVLADVSVFSFHAVKNLTTAEGGAICWNLPDEFDHDEIYRVINVMSLHGQSKDALAKTKSGAWRYDVEFPGYKCNMTDMHASIGLIDLKYYGDNLKARSEMFGIYDEALKQYDWAITPTYQNSDQKGSLHIYALRIKVFTEAQKDDLINRMAGEQIMCNVHFIPLPLLSAYKSYSIKDYPKAYEMFCQELSLPIFIGLTKEEQHKVVECLDKHITAIKHA